ncbi:hypothetical protein [Mesonia maritima]|uniref:Glycerophosphoryl diester phosphodiesterase membrane domain-containing protein n=1 Tax=Mesonia maritima TaxID=1793873 RepID=A0ABU1K5H6_9FLAO|nr:hypothetical protein [Mesonia maritima]MDR6300862.1 hypothetical protein [Mesonia maritima]
MEQTNYINFKKERELGEVISDTFAFIRQNYKVLFQIYTKVLWPVLLLMLLAICYYTYITLNLGEDIMSLSGSTNPSSGMFSAFSGIFLASFVLLIASWFYYTFLYGSYQYAVNSYIENNGEIKIDEVKEGLKQNWSSFLGASFLAGLLTFIGAIMCLVPGIYVMVPFTLLYSIMVFYKMGVSESITYSFSLIKNNWWITFFTIIVISIIYFIITYVFNLPAIIYTLVKSLVYSQEGNLADPSFAFDWVYLTLSALSSVVQYLLYPIIIIATVFIFFNLDEKKNQTGTYEAIDSLGKKD